MAQDVATLSLKLDAQQMLDGLGKVASSSDAAAQAGRRLTGAQQELIAKADKLAATANALDIQNKKAVASYIQEVGQVRALAQQLGVLDEVERRTSASLQDATSHMQAFTHQMKNLEAETGIAVRGHGNLIAAHASIGASAGVSAGRLNSLRSSVTSMAAALVGTAPGVAQFTGVLGTMALGSGLMIGVLGGMAALGFAWDKLTEKARKAKEEHQKAIDVLEKLREKEDQGPAGPVGKATAVRSKDLADQVALVRRLEAEQRALATIKPTAEDAEGIATEKARVELRLASARQALIDMQDLVSRGNRETARLIKEANDQAKQQDASALAERLSFNQKDAAARKAALALLAEDKKKYEDLLKLPSTRANSQELARLASERKQLQDALTGDKTDARRQAAQALARDNIAEQEERRVEAAKALAKAAGESQAAYEREAHTQQLKNELLTTEQRIRASFLDQNGKQRAGTQALMDAEIARAKVAIQTRDALDQQAKAALKLGADQQTLDALNAKIKAYQGLGPAIADATVEEEYAVRLAQAAAIADEEQRKKAEALAKAIRDKTVALHASQAAYDKEKKAADEAVREQERRDRQRQRILASSLEQVFTDIVNRKNPLVALVDGFKRAFIRALSEALAEKFLASKFAALFGIGVEGAAKKQLVAAAGMNEAARLQKEAADIMLRAAGFDPTAKAPEKKTEDVKVPAWVTKLKTALEYAAVGVAGFGAGYATAQSLYSTSHGAVGNYARGAVGGAVSGAITGATIGSAFGPVGAAAGGVIGGVTGLIGGILGIGKASKEAAKQTAELRAALKISMDGLRAEVGKDALAASIAQVEAQRETIRKQIEDAYSGGGANSDTVRERNRQLAELNRLEDTRIRQLREEAQAIATRQLEDFQARRDAAIPGNEKAEAIAEFNRARDREREDLVRSFGDVIDAQEAATLAMADQAFAAEKAKFALDQNTKAVDALTTALHNAPTGYKVESRIYQFATPRPRETPRTSPAIPVPTAPIAPPMNPVSPPTLSKSGGASIVNNFYIDGTKTTRAQVQQIATELKKVVTETLGSNADVSEGWGLLA